MNKPRDDLEPQDAAASPAGTRVEAAQEPLKDPLVQSMMEAMERRRQIIEDQKARAAEQRLLLEGKKAAGRAALGHAQDKARHAKAIADRIQAKSFAKRGG